MRLAPSLSTGLVTLFVGHAAAASPAAYDCDRTIQEISQAKQIVVAKAKAVATTLKDKRWIVRVTYAVDKTLVGKEGSEVVVEEECLDTPIPEAQVGYPGVAQHCVNTQAHLLPGLDEAGKAVPVSAALVLTEKKSALDGKPVAGVVRQSAFTPCADVTALLKARPELAAISKEVMDTNGKTQFGLPPSPSMPPPPVVPSASASVSASVSASASAVPSANAKPSAVPVTTALPPAKSGGCGCTVGATAAGPWPLLAVLLAFARRRRQ
ncbi:MAG: MYXO-CTERM sorting domain-containing protein [Myxococcales bacterium]|nr:MYXO-CTERM sorting domain-containing protein [Myxococcales bacterium]